MENISNISTSIQTLCYKVVDVTALTPCTKTVGGKSTVNSVNDCRYCRYMSSSSQVFEAGGPGK